MSGAAGGDVNAAAIRVLDQQAALHEGVARALRAAADDLRGAAPAAANKAELPSRVEPPAAENTLRARVLASLARLARPVSVADVIDAGSGGTKLSVRSALRQLVEGGQAAASGVKRARRYWLVASRLPDRPTASVGSLSDGPGDEKQESAPAEIDSGRARIEIGRARTAADWLQSRGYQVEALEGGRWRADRKTLDTAAMIALANRRRADLNMAPYVLRGVA